MKRTPGKPEQYDLGQIINMFWDNHNKNESIIQALMQYQQTQPTPSKTQTIKEEPNVTSEAEEKKPLPKETIKKFVKSIKVDPIEPLTELPKEGLDMRENQTYQEMTSCFYQKEDITPDDKGIGYYLSQLPPHLKITEKRLLFIFSKIKEKWPTCDFPYNKDIAFKLFELKQYNSSLVYRFVLTKTFPKYLAEYYKTH